MKTYVLVQRLWGSLVCAKARKTEVQNEPATDAENVVYNFSDEPVWLEFFHSCFAVSILSL